MSQKVPFLVKIAKPAYFTKEKFFAAFRVSPKIFEPPDRTRNELKKFWVEKGPQILSLQIEREMENDDFSSFLPQKITLLR